jgi:hypothetical protein
MYTTCVNTKILLLIQYKIVFNVVFRQREALSG